MEKTFMIPFREGLHARPAAQLVKLAESFQSTIELAAGKEAVNARSILGIMRLGLRQGDQVHVRITGPDAPEALAAVEALLNGDRRGAGAR